MKILKEILLGVLLGVLGGGLTYVILKYLGVNDFGIGLLCGMVIVHIRNFSK